MKLLISNFHDPLHYFLPLSPQILLSVQFQTPSAFDIPLMWDSKLDTHTKQQETLVLYILIFMFWNVRKEDKRFLTKWQQAFPEFKLLLIALWILFDLVISFQNSWSLP